MMMHKRLATNYKSMRNKRVSITKGITLNFQFTKSKSDFVLVLLYLVCSLGYIAFVGHQPIQILAYMAHDDAMFWTHAFNIVSWNWLGDYSEMTLPKGSGFPLVEAFGAILGIPIQILSALILIGALALLIRALNIFKINRWFLFSGFLLTLSQMSLIMVRPLRDYVYASLVFVVIAVVLEFSREQRKNDVFRFVIFGALVGLFLITREENPWVIPGVILLLFGVLLYNRKQGLELRLTAIRALVTVGGITFVHVIIMSLNLLSYGTFTTQDFTYGSFPKALSALQSVEEFPQPRHVPVSKENRDAIYRASPAFAELKPYFEGPGLFWTKFGCSIEGEPCDEYATGWFMWALRDGAARAGHYQTPSKADRFFQRLENEVTAACEAGTLKCIDSNFSVIPKFPPSAAQEVLPVIGKISDVMLYKDVHAQLAMRSEGDQQALFLIRAFLGSPKIYPSAEQDVGRFSGWIYAPSLTSLDVKCDGVKPQAKISWMPSPDIVEAFKDEKAANSRFNVTYTSSANCFLKIETSEGSEIISVVDIRQNKLIRFSGGEAYFESSLESMVDRPNALPSKIKQAFIEFDRHVNPILLFGGFASALLAIAIQISRRRSSPFTAFIIPAFFILIASRVALLVVVAITSFPAINEQYVLPATALIPFAGVLGFHALFQEVRLSVGKRFSKTGDAPSLDSSK